MNVLIINTSDISGGAARAAYRLQKGLNRIGVDSFMLVKEKKTSDERVLKVEASENTFGSSGLNIINAIQDKYINQKRTPLTNTKFTFPYPGYDLSGLEIIKQADILNLHYLASFQSIESIQKLLLLGKPVVWTLHDQWAFTGGCHFSAGCDKYKTDCSECPQLENDEFNITKKVLSHKLSLIDRSKLFILTPSQWLTKTAQKSFLFKELHIKTIPNSIETDLFYPYSADERAECKKKFNIQDNVITILFGALLGNIKRKGFDKLLEAFESFSRNKKFRKLVKKKKIKLLCFGTSSSDIERINIPCYSLGDIADDNKLRDIYNASDIFVLPSTEDNLPNTMLESMSCGTPVIAFDIGGMPDLIMNHKTGKLIPPFDTEKFGDAMINLALNEEERQNMGTNSRQLIESRYKLEDQAQNYAEFFSSLRPKKHSKFSPSAVQKNHYCPVQSSFDDVFLPLYNRFVFGKEK